MCALVRGGGEPRSPLLGSNEICVEFQGLPAWARFESHLRCCGIPCPCRLVRRARRAGSPPPAGLVAPRRHPAATAGRTNRRRRRLRPRRRPAPRVAGCDRPPTVAAEPNQTARDLLALWPPDAARPSPQVLHRHLSLAIASDEIICMGAGHPYERAI